MSRSTDFVFVEVDADALDASLVNAYQRITGTTLRPASPERLFIKWVVSVITQERAMINYAANQCIPSRADGENLDALGELFFLTERPAAQSARCTVRFSISESQDTAVIVPAGTRVTDASQTLYWATETDALVPSGATTIDIPVVCETAGTVGNGWAAGQINTIVDVFDYYSGCVSITPSDGGTDAMTDDEYYELMQASLNAYSTAGAAGAYEYHAKRVSSEIGSVIVASPDACEVRIYALMDDGTPATAEIKAAILEACNAESVRPLTDHVLVEDPAAHNYNLTMTYYLDGNDQANASVTQAAVNAAVDDFILWQGSALGRSINPSVLIQKVMAAGAKRVEVTSPVFTELEDGSGTNAPEYAKLNTKTVTNGGFEYGT